MLRRARSWLEDPRLLYWLPLLGMLLAAPSLFNGLALDDWGHRQVMLHGRNVVGHPTGALDMFSFFPDDPDLLARLQEQGVWPWWGSTRLQLEFFRPLTALTHWLDYRLWPDYPALMHLQSLLWYAVLIAAVTWLLRRILGPGWQAGLAALLFTVADAHGTTVGWIANRNALIACSLAVIALGCHDRWRRAGWKAGRWLSPVLFGLALLAGEIAVAFLAYLLCHAWLLDRDRGRWRSLWPYAALTVLWQIGYGLAGYGTQGTGVYIQPLGEPLRFAWAILERGPILLFSRMFVPVADGWAFMPSGHALLLSAAAIAGLVALGLVAGDHWRGERPTLFLVAGAGLSLVPACAVVPSDRVLVVSSLGVSAALAALLPLCRARASSGGARLLLMALLARHLLLAPLLLPARSLLPRLFAGAMSRGVATAPSDSALEQQTLVIVNAPHLFFCLVGLWRRVGGGIEPRRQRCLGTSAEPVTLMRTDAHTVVLETERGYLGTPADQLVWSPAEPRGAGFELALSDVTIRVLEATADRRPRKVAFRFDESLESSELRWVTWGETGFAALELPAVGEFVELPASPPNGALLAADRAK